MKEIWWQTSSLSFLETALSKINLANNKSNHVEKTSDLFQALNVIWNQFYDFRKNLNQLTTEEVRFQRRADTESFSELLKQGLSEQGIQLVLQSDQLKNIVNLEPRIMNYEVLRRNSYDPTNISKELKRKSQERHTKLVDSFSSYQQKRWKRQTIDELDELLKDLAKLLYVVRSNNAHGEKTPRGPDWQKVKRDQTVCQAINPLLELIIDLIFAQPSTRLAVYGTLAPNKPNESVLSNLKGDWINGKVNGLIEQVENLPSFKWVSNDREIEIQLFCSEELPKSWSKIDRFEGGNHRRILVPVKLENNVFTVANIYSFKSERSKFKQEIRRFEEDLQMPYVTSVERLARQEGLDEGILQKGREDVIDVLTIRFSDVPPSLVEAINQIEDPSLLKTLLRQAIITSSIAEFQGHMSR